MLINSSRRNVVRSARIHKCCQITVQKMVSCDASRRMFEGVIEFRLHIGAFGS